MPKRKTELLTISEIARRVKLDRHTVSSRLKERGCQPDESSLANKQLFLFDRRMEIALRTERREKDALSAARLRLLLASVELKELNLAKTRGELASVAEMTEIATKFFSVIYREFTMHQPRRLAGHLVRCKTTGEIMKVLRTDTEKFMQRLRTADIQELLGECD